MANPLMGLLGGNQFPQSMNGSTTNLMSKLSLLKNFRQNPMGIISEVYGVPVGKSPQEQAQILLNSGKISQSQMDESINLARMLQNVMK